MKLKLIALFVLCSSALFGQQPQKGSTGKEITPEAFYKMQFNVEDQGYIVKPEEVTALMESAVQLASAGKLDTLSLIRVHSRCRELMFFAIRQKKRNLDEVKGVFQTIDKELYSFLGCDQKQSYYHDIFMKDSTSRRTLETVVTGLQKCHCQNVDLYLKTAKRLYDMDTTPEKAMQLSRYFLQKSGYGFALPLLQKACKSSDPLVASEANLEIASSYRFYGRLEEAVGFARQALQLNPSNGMAYVIIGDCYFLGAANCGNTDVEKTGALWAAYDKYQKALKTDASLREIVKLRMAVVSHRFPDAAALTGSKLTEGAPYKVACWIKETTQVRARNK